MRSLRVLGRYFSVHSSTAGGLPLAGNAVVVEAGAAVGVGAAGAAPTGLAAGAAAAFLGDIRCTTAAKSLAPLGGCAQKRKEQRVGNP